LVAIDEHIHVALLSVIRLFIKSPLTPATSEVGGTIQEQWQSADSLPPAW
jgi:hypothetical protein